MQCTHRKQVSRTCEQRGIGTVPVLQYDQGLGFSDQSSLRVGENEWQTFDARKHFLSQNGRSSKGGVSLRSGVCVGDGPFVVTLTLLSLPCATVSIIPVCVHKLLIAPLPPLFTAKYSSPSDVVASSGLRHHRSQGNKTPAVAVAVAVVVVAYDTICDLSLAPQRARKLSRHTLSLRARERFPSD